MSDDKLLDTVGTAGTPINIPALITAQVRMRIRGVPFDELEFQLAQEHVSDVEMALMVGPGNVASFRGVRVKILGGAKDSGGRSRLVVPPTAHNDREGVTGLRVDIVGGVDDALYRPAPSTAGADR